MIKAIVTAISIAIATGVAQSVPPRDVTLQDLTVPAERLPAGCVVAAAPSIRVEPNQVRSGFWGDLPITSNPWTGTDRHLIATIRSRMEPPPAGPDGPPLHRRAAAGYFLHLADGVEEGYAAFYTDAEQSVIAVYASKLAASDGSVDRSRGTQAFTNPTAVRVEIGPIRAMVSVGRGECFDAVAAHVTSLAK